LRSPAVGASYPVVLDRHGWLGERAAALGEDMAQTSRRAPQVQMYDMEVVKKMRGATGAGLSACKKALKEADGDYDKAMEILRQSGILKAGKRAGKAALQGMIHSYIHQGSKLGVMLEVNCETDFAARTDKFQDLVKKITMQIVINPSIEYVSIDSIPAKTIAQLKKAQAEADDLQGKPDQIKDKIIEGRLQKLLKSQSLLDQPCNWDEDMTVGDYVKEMTSILGENVKVTRFKRYILGGMQQEEEETEAEVVAEKPAEKAAEETAQPKATEEQAKVDEADAAAAEAKEEEERLAKEAEEAKMWEQAWAVDEPAAEAEPAAPVEAAAPAEKDEFEQLKKDIGKRKAELKAQGMSGSQCNKDEQVVAWVARMTELKAAAEKDTGELTPSDVKSDFLRRMVDRGFFNQCSDLKSLDEKMLEAEKTGKPVAAYLGFDATANSLHVGSLLQIMILRHLQKSGHKPIVLVGGGTTKVGDPSGKDESRKMMTEDDIQSNIDGITSVFKKFLVFGDGPTDAELVNNDDWLSGLNYLQFLRDYGKHFTINRMLSFDSVKLRLDREQPLTFLEFNYMILQGFDFLELHRRKGVQVQIGGSDQWGNIINGIELGRKVDQASLFGLTAPLITKADGSKMGKTASGAVWLNEDLLSPYDYWQFWRSCDDADVEKFLKIFTELPLDEIKRLASLEGKEINEAKIILADEATSLLHGADKLESIKETAKSLFGGGGKSDANLPTVSGAVGSYVLDLYIDLGFAKSKGEVRRLIGQGGARLNDVKIEDQERVLAADDFSEEGKIKLSFGKKKHGIVQLA